MILQSDTYAFLGNLVPIALIVVVMYFFFIRPQAKKQKAQMSFLDSLQKGKKVVTGSGIVGIITKLDDKTVTLKISDKGFMEVVKSAISQEMTASFEKE
jgi:preprotein translocase, YajC subunit